MAIDRGRRMKQAKSVNVIVKLSCLLLLSQPGTVAHILNAQILTRADLQAQTAIYEAASSPHFSRLPVLRQVCGVMRSFPALCVKWLAGWGRFW